MREICMSGLMSGEGKRSVAVWPKPPPHLAAQQLTGRPGQEPPTRGHGLHGPYLASACGRPGAANPHQSPRLADAQRTTPHNRPPRHPAGTWAIPAPGPKNARELAGVVLAEGDETIPACVRAALAPLVRQLHALDQEIARSDRTIAAMARGDERARRLMTIPGLGPVTASAIAASVQDVSAFSGPREFAAFLGLTPRQNSSGGKERLGRVSKMGNRYLRKLLVVGAHAVLYHRKPHEDALRSFAKKLMQTKPFKLVAVALANKMARIAFAIMRGRTTYSAAPA